MQTQSSINQKAIQILIKIPYPTVPTGGRLRIQCSSPVLQMAFTHLAFLAGLIVYNPMDQTVPLLTDDHTYMASAQQVLWIQPGAQPIPKGIHAKVDLSITPNQLREAVEAVIRGELWGVSETEVIPLSERELEMMTLLAKGLRDRDIANHLIISESTVKFHINNILTKLKARTRYQALHEVIVKGWIN